MAAAVATGAVIWIVGQDLGGVLAGNATDVNSGPLLILIALAYWPRRDAQAPRPGREPGGRWRPRARSAALARAAPGPGGGTVTGPAWLAGALAAVVLTVAVFGVGRLVLGWRRPGEADADVVHVLMGVAMAGMFVPRLATLPDSAWEIAFAAGAAWFGWRAVRDRTGAGPAAVPGRAGAGPAVGPDPAGRRRWCACPVPHLVDCLAMVYVLWAVPAVATAGRAGGTASGMAGMSTAAGRPGAAARARAGPGRRHLRLRGVAAGPAPVPPPCSAGRPRPHSQAGPASPWPR